jgi:micrococcal nuclease
MKKLLLICTIILSQSPQLFSQTVSLNDLKNYIGKPDTIKVCGKIYSTRYLDRAERKPTLLNVGDHYPMQKLTVVIFEEDRSKFPPKPEEYFSNTQVCISGVVIDYNGKPEIVMRDIKQIEIDFLRPETKEDLAVKKVSEDTPVAKLNIDIKLPPVDSAVKETVSIQQTQDLKNSQPDGNYMIAQSNLRSGPSTDFPVTATVPKGSKVTVLYTNKIWSKVEVEIVSKSKGPVNVTGYLRNTDFQ